MKNPVTFYVIIAVGVIGLALGAYFYLAGGHHKIGIAGLVVGIILLIGGIAGMVMARPKAAV